MSAEPTLSKPKISKGECGHLHSLFAAWIALKKMGWEEPRYFKFPPEGQQFELIELGSTGIHRAVVRGLNPLKTCWVDYEWPSQPFLVRRIEASK